MQRRAYDQVFYIPLGTYFDYEALRANVKNPGAVADHGILGRRQGVTPARRSGTAPTMVRLIVSRIAAAVPVMLIVATIVFLLLRVSPGDPATILAGEAATPEAIARIRAELGLDRPIPIQYLTWLGEIAKGNLGQSILSRQPVWTLIRDRLEPTLVLAVSAIIITVIIAVPLGLLAAWRHNTWIDRAVMAPRSSASRCRPS